MIIAPGMTFGQVMQAYIMHTLRRGEVRKEELEMKRIWTGPGGSGVYSIKEILDVVSSPGTTVDEMKGIMGLKLEQTTSEVMDMLYEK